MNPRRFLLFATAVLAFALPVAFAQQADLKGKPVTFRGCVVTGIPPTTIRLTNVAEVGAAAPTKPLQVVYWMDKTQESLIRQHLGARVEVTATITDAPNRSVSELTPNDGVFGFENRAPAPQAAANTGAEPGAVGTSGTETEIESRLLRITVDKVRMVGSCP